MNKAARFGRVLYNNDQTDANMANTFDFVSYRVICIHLDTFSQ